MTRPVLIVTALLLLTGCNAHVAGVAGYTAIEMVKPMAIAVADKVKDMSAEDPGEEK